VKAIFGYQEDVLALRDTVFDEPELAGPEGDAMGQAGTDCKALRGDEDRDDSVTPVQILFGDDNDRMRCPLAEIRHVDFAGIHD